MSAGRPRPVTRHLRRPLWWLAISLTVSGIWLGFIFDDAADEREARAAWPHLIARVPASYEGGRHEVPVIFEHPVTHETIQDSVVVVRNSLLPMPGGTMTIAADPANPDRVVVPGDGDENPDALIAFAIVNGVVAVAGLARWRAVRQIERMIGSGRPVFAMTGALGRGGFDSRRVHLHLYALDAPAGARPICTYTLLTTAQLPIGGPAFPVEVRGRPVPGSAVVAYGGSGVLWPLRRPMSRGTEPRPAAVGAPPRPLPVVAPADAPSRAAPPSLPTVLSWRIFAPAAVAILSAVVIPITLINNSTSRRAAERATPVWAEVVAHVGTDGASVRYGPPGEPRTRDATAAAHPDTVIGRIYPARVDPADPAHVRLDADPYDPVEPLVYLAIVAGIAVLVPAGAVSWWLEARRLAAHGPWHEVEARPSSRSDEVALVARGEHDPIAIFAGRPESGQLLAATTFDPGEPAVISPRFDGPVVEGPATRWTWPQLGRGSRPR